MFILNRYGRLNPNEERINRLFTVANVKGVNKTTIEYWGGMNVYVYALTCDGIEKSCLWFVDRPIERERSKVLLEVRLENETSLEECKKILKKFEKKYC